MLVFLFPVICDWIFLFPVICDGHPPPIQVYHSNQSKYVTQFTEVQLVCIYTAQLLPADYCHTIICTDAETLGFFFFSIFQAPVIICFSPLTKFSQKLLHRPRSKFMGSYLFVIFPDFFFFFSKIFNFQIFMIFLKQSACSFAFNFAV